MVDRTCPGCGKDRVATVEEAEAIYRTGQWGGIDQMLADATMVCTFCKCVKVRGAWKRMQTVDSRARELAQASGSKTFSDYQEILTAGPKAVEDRT